MNEKLQTRLTIIALIVIIIIGIFFKGIPELKKTLGSSDKFITSKNYDDMVEFDINNNLNFAVVIQSKKINHILMFNEESVILYNQDIENNSISKSISMITNLLINSNNLTPTSQVTLTSYENKYYNEVKQSFINELKSNNYNNITILEKQTTIEKKVKRLEIEYSKKDDLISKLDIYSKNIISSAKTNENSYSTTESKSISKEQAKEYANNVYKKLENYVINNNIGEQDKNDTSLPINLIPASSDNTIYPNLDSWYYIKNKQVFAYIAIDTKDQTYGWCYNGGIDNYKEGEC